MGWAPPLVLHGAHRADEAALTAHEERFAADLARLASRAAADTLEAPAGADVERDDRPTEAGG